jgi:nucleotide-binding universal stress UspA family protein
MAITRLQHPLNITLAVDGSEHSLAATALLRDLPLPTGSIISALAVLDLRPSISQAALVTALEQAQTLLREKGVKVTTELLRGHPAAALTKYADEHSPDLIVLGAKGLRATLGILLGGIAQQMVEYAHWPVLVVRAPYTSLRRILLVTDGSVYSDHAVDYMARFSIPADADLRVAHVLPPSPWLYPSAAFGPIVPGMMVPLPSGEVDEAIAAQAEEEKRWGEALLAQTLERLRSSGVEASSALLQGDAATEIIEYVKTNQVDLVVSGSRGLSQVRGWLLGSVSRKLVHYAGCSVLVVKGMAEHE